MPNTIGPPDPNQTIFIPEHPEREGEVSTAGESDPARDWSGFVSQQRPGAQGEG
jgi:hypothetical protein